MSNGQSREQKNKTKQKKKREEFMFPGLNAM